MEVKRGRPRKYPEGYVRPRGKKVDPNRGRMTKQEVAELYNGTPIVQLDYESGEFIGDYPSMTAVANDYDVPLGTVISAFQKDTCCIVRLPKYQLLLIKKKHYEKIINGGTR